MNVIIFGASSGIGEALAKLCVERGHKVAITGRRLPKLKEIQLTDREKILIKQHDVRDISSLQTVFDELVQQLGGLDMVILSSGIGELNRELMWEKELNTINTNILGAANVLSQSYRFFRKQGYGHIVGISSIAGMRRSGQAPAYSASKAFLSNFLESLWLKAKKNQENIVVTDIVPGFIDTDMAKGDTFWMASTQKAAKQIYEAIKKKKRRVYITKRWRLIAILLRTMPIQILRKF